MKPSAAPLPGSSFGLPSVSFALVQDLLQSLRAICSEKDLSRCMLRACIVQEYLEHPGARLTHDQVVRLYQECAVATDDEMMGLWSRPIRTGTLKYLIRAMMHAPSIRVALYRFTQFWNLLLDDYGLLLSHEDGVMRLVLVPASKASKVNRFGHALMLKLAHGIVSWLVGREAAVLRVEFSFPRPVFAADYPILFPAPVGFCAKYSAITFEAELGKTRSTRKATEVHAFLQRAPRDWIFTAYREHALRLKVREVLYADLGRTLVDIARLLHTTPRTLMRKLKNDQLSFQGIKDDVRRELAHLYLAQNSISLGEIAYSLGYSSPAVFHRAFRQWTNMTPGAYRAAQQALLSQLEMANASR